MDIALLSLHLVLVLVNVSAAVVCVWHARHPPDRQLRLELDELLTHVERLSADQKREKMRRVRAAAQPEEQRPISHAELKQLLRRKAALGELHREPEGSQ